MVLFQVRVQFCSENSEAIQALRGLKLSWKKRTLVLFFGALKSCALYLTFCTGPRILPSIRLIWVSFLLLYCILVFQLLSSCHQRLYLFLSLSSSNLIFATVYPLPYPYRLWINSFHWLVTCYIYRTYPILYIL